MNYKNIEFKNSKQFQISFKLLIISLISIIILILISLSYPKLDYQSKAFQHGDHLEYISMAKYPPFGNRSSPFMYRILSPIIAFWLPFDLEASFYFIAFFSLFFTNILLFVFLKLYDLSDLLSITGIFLVNSSFWFSRFYMYDFWLVDPLAFFFLISCFIFIKFLDDIESNKISKIIRFLFSVILVIGILDKESVILVSIFFIFKSVILVKQEKMEIKALKYDLLLILPAILTFIFIRVVFPPLKTDFDLVITIPFMRIKDFFNEPINIIFQLTVGTFGIVIISFIPFYFTNHKKINNFLVPSIFFLFAIYLQLFLAVNTERLLILGFPIIILFSLKGMEYFTDSLQIHDAFFLFLSITQFICLIVSLSQFLYFLIFIILLIIIILIKKIGNKKYLLNLNGCQ